MDELEKHPKQSSFNDSGKLATANCLHSQNAFIPI